MQYAIVSLENRTQQRIREALPDGCKVVAKLDDLAVLVACGAPTALPFDAVSISESTAELLLRKAQQ